jgi:hypothetical protein
VSIFPTRGRFILDAERQQRRFVVQFLAEIIADNLRITTKMAYIR